MTIEQRVSTQNRDQRHQDRGCGFVLVRVSAQSIGRFGFWFWYRHSVYINIVTHKALTSVLISKSLAELAAEGS